MVENYLQEARRRFEAEESARKREKAQQVEAEERRKREIYLNGGYLDCPNAGCEGRGTAETNYQCPVCTKQQQQQRQEERFCQTEGNSKFYVEGVDLSSDEQGGSSIGLAHFDLNHKIKPLFKQGWL